MTTQEWNKLRRYREGERCQRGGQIYEAGLDIPAGVRPDAVGSHHIWRKVGLPVVKVAPQRQQRQAPVTGYLTRDMATARR